MEIEITIDNIIALLETNEIKVLVNRNPNEEEIERIKKAIQRTEEIRNTFSGKNVK